MIMTTVAVKTEVLANLQSFLESICAEHNVPALSVAVWYDNQLYQASTGILNMDTRVEATPDSIFQIGSISKVFTASLIMQLVDEDKVDLEAPVKQYLRDFQVADPEVTNRVTVGQLLDHTNGIAGDFLPDVSFTEENAIARYVDRCNLLPKVHSPGTRHSYSNAAYSIAGRLIEVILGCSWFDAIVERIFEPLGMKQSIAHPSQVLRHRAAIGHVANPDQPEVLIPAADCYLPLGWAPGGATISMSAADLILFARAHLDEGCAQSGQVWLSAIAVKNMQTSRIKVPKDAYPFATHWGLGWQIVNRPGVPLMVSHGGVVIGQTSMFHVVPEQQLAIAILQNCKEPSALYGISHTLLSELANINLKEKAPVTECQQDLHCYQGKFSTVDAEIELWLEEGELIGESTSRITSEYSKYKLKPISKSCFASYSATGERESNIVFLDFDSEGKPDSLYTVFRVFRRI